MKNTKTFDFDLDWGNFWEADTALFIEPLFNKELNKNGQFISWTTLRSSDIYPNKKDWWRFDTLYNIYSLDNPNPQKKVRFEIKADKYDNTGNICIEKMCGKKLSGVFHTESEYFIYYMPRYNKDNLYICKPEKMTKFLQDNFEACLKMVGDGSRSMSYIINKNSFDELFLEQKIGKIFTWIREIPERFNINKFNNDGKVVYNSQKKVDYDEDPLKFV